MRTGGELATHTPPRTPSPRLAAPPRQPAPGASWNALHSLARRSCRRIPHAHSCNSQGAAYGKCIGARYQDVDKGMCAAEFQAFRQCVTQAVSPALPFVLHMLELWLTLRTRCPGLDEATGPLMRRFRQSVQDSQDTRAGSAHRDVCHFRQTSTSNPQILRSFPSPPLALADARLVNSLVSLPAKSLVARSRLCSPLSPLPPPRRPCNCTKPFASLRLATYALAERAATHSHYRSPAGSTNPSSTAPTTPTR